MNRSRARTVEGAGTEMDPAVEKMSGVYLIGMCLLLLAIDHSGLYDAPGLNKFAVFPGLGLLVGTLLITRGYAREPNGAAVFS